MEYNYTAIVLKKREIGETDRIYTFYTLESGKVQAIGKGVRKPKAKLAGHLETLNRSDIIIARRHGLGNIASALTEKYCSHLKEHPEALAKALEAIGYFERLVDFEERDIELFLLLQEYLEMADQSAKEGSLEYVRLVTEGFLFKMLGHLGYRLEVYRCALSGAALEEGRPYYFSPEAGGVIGAEFVSQSRRSLSVGGNAIKLMRIFFQNRLSSLRRLKTDEKALAQVERISRAFLMWTLH
jgi:DNA repair protein RecO (recombination protein O)